MKEFVTAITEAVNETDGTPVEDQYIEFKIDGRIVRAYEPTDGQLTFMMAAMGRGQDDNQRFASIMNLMLSVFRDDDKDWLEGRLLSRDPKQKMPVKQMEAVFEYLVEEWFARPTQQPSDSASSPPSDGTN